MNHDDILIKQSQVLKDVYIIAPTVNYDSRGTIFTTYNKESYNRFLPSGLNFIHDKFAESKHNVLRGLHGDNKTWKLITCIYGEILEVVVDMRPDSNSYLKHDSFELNSKNKKQILVPPSFVNGYYVLSEFAVFHYKLAYEGRYFDTDKQFVVKWNDPRLKINWPCTEPILQARDNQ